MKISKLNLVNNLYSKYVDDSAFVLSPREMQIRKLEEQNRYLEMYLSNLQGT